MSNKKSKKKKSLSDKVWFSVLYISIFVLVIIGIKLSWGAISEFQFDNSEDKSSYITTFDIRESAETCMEDGKPVVRMFSTSWCPHCNWVKQDFNDAVKKYVDNGEIVAYHWVLDLNDDVLTSEEEGVVPDSELAIFKDFNPKTSIPTFVFGCKYYRVGTGFESVDDHTSERREFKAIIEELIKKQ